RRRRAPRLPDPVRARGAGDRAARVGAHDPGPRPLPRRPAASGRGPAARDRRRASRRGGGRDDWHAGQNPRTHRTPLAALARAGTGGAAMSPLSVWEQRARVARAVRQLVGAWCERDLTHVPIDLLPRELCGGDALGDDTAAWLSGQRSAAPVSVLTSEIGGG